jgi:glyoxylase-like metal-dependent hydrolase (beta-lactamase superfamily II)
MREIEEIVPGIHHWTAHHEGIGFEVSSYYVEPARALIDPMTPPGGLGALDGLDEPEVILLTNRHHHRNSARFVERFGCPVRCHQSGLHEFEDGLEEVEGFRFGDEPAPGIVALEMGSICPDDSVLGIDVGGGALAFADALIDRGEGRVGFVRDHYMDEPDVVKRGIRAATKRLLAEQRFDTLLFAHGYPIVGAGRAALAAFLESDEKV